jgi:hypothetical protein
MRPELSDLKDNIIPQAGRHDPRYLTAVSHLPNNNRATYISAQQQQQQQQLQ